MIGSKLLITFLSTLFLLQGCNDSSSNPKDYFSFVNIKKSYKSDDVINLSINNKKKVKLDSIIIYFDDQKYTRLTDSSNTFIELTNQKLGYHKIEALVYFEGKSKLIKTSIISYANKAPKKYKFEIINTYPHDQKAYTQGYEFHKGFLYEGTGNGAGNYSGVRGTSSIRKTDPKTGRILKKTELDVQYFGEGITILDNKIYQLTWRHNTGFIYNLDTFEKIDSFTYFKDMEGWGLTNDGTNLYMSDGTDKIYSLNPKTLKKINQISVYSNKTKIPSINELEWVDGYIWANIYQKDALALINPKNGAVIGVVDLSPLKSKVTQHGDLDVLNGIAYNKETNTFWITGKNWDKAFEIKLFESKK